MLPEAIQKFIEIFEKLPSIGSRQATRLAFYLIQQGQGKINELGNSLFKLGNLKNCSDCFLPYSDPKPQIHPNLQTAIRNYDSDPKLRQQSETTNAPESTNSDPIHLNPQNSAPRLCAICSNPKRNKSIIAVVEKETDLISLEKTKKFNGRYLIIGDLKKTGILESGQKLRLNHLKDFIKKHLTPSAGSGQGQAEEIILALNPTTYGDLNADLITQELKGFAKKISRLGRGIPTGGEIEFADEETLGSALERRM
jgi:recombination protein RecR